MTKRDPEGPVMACSRRGRVVRDMFAAAGVALGGSAQHDICVHDARFFDAVLRDGELGMGESYMAGWWDCPELDALATRFIASGMLEAGYLNPKVVFYHLATRLSRIGSRDKSFRVGEVHYDLGNDLFKAMLDPRMIYSCGYFAETDDLAEAQVAKLDLICRKLGLQPGQHILDIGCGWGGFARFAAENYGVSVVGVTVSKEQASFAREQIGDLPIEIRLADYRTLNEPFDNIASIAMLEAVGHRYYDAFFDVAQRCLNPGGRLAVHAFYSPAPLGPHHARWLDKYIFPGGAAPSLAQVLKAAEGKFAVEAMQRIDDYDRTLEAWDANFRQAWPQLSEVYDERFFRMWTYYLGISRGIFRSRLCHVWHIVFSRELPGVSETPKFFPLSEIEAR